MYSKNNFQFTIEKKRILGLKHTISTIILMLLFHDNNAQNTVNQYFSLSLRQDYIIWSEDFDSVRWAASVSPFDSVNLTGNVLIDSALVPDGWIVCDSTGNNFYWHWSQLGPRGRFTSYVSSNPISSLIPSSDPTDILASQTASNGFMMLEADYFNTTPDGNTVVPLVNMNSMIMSPSLDLSQAQALVLRFSHRFRLLSTLNTILSVFVSSDFDLTNPSAAHWTEFSLRTDAPSFEYNINNPAIRDIDITAAAARKPNVRIMWKMASIPLYVWMIDDIFVFEPFANNITISNIAADYIALPYIEFTDWFHYTMIPRDLTSHFIQCRSNVKNVGYITQKNIVLSITAKHNGIPFYQKNSQPVDSIQPFDTQAIVLQTSFKPKDMGRYDVIYRVDSDSTDQYETDNKDSLNFMVSDHTYSRVSRNTKAYVPVCADIFLGGNADGSGFGVYYQIPDSANPVTPYSLSAFIPKLNDSVAVYQGKFSMVAKLFLDTEESGFNLVAQSLPFILNINHLGTWVEVPFQTDTILTLVPGRYLTSLFLYTSTPTGNHNPFYISADTSVKEPPEGVNLRYTNHSWIPYNINLAIDFHVVPTVIQTTHVKFVIDMQYAANQGIFHPSEDKVDIAGYFNNLGNPPDYLEKINDCRYMTEKNFETGKSYSFTFRINGSIFENIDRWVTATGDSVVCNCFWGFPLGNHHEFKTDLEVFPNPFSDFFQIHNHLAGNLLTVYTVDGKILIKKRLQVNSEIIDTRCWEKGLYVLKINNIKNSGGVVLKILKY